MLIWPGNHSFLLSFQRSHTGVNGPPSHPENRAWVILLTSPKPDQSFSHTLKQLSMNMNVVEQITAVHIISYLECMTRSAQCHSIFTYTHSHLDHPPAIVGRGFGSNGIKSMSRGMSGDKHR